MKIILNCLSKAWGGRETCFFDDLTELNKQGHNVIAIISKNSEIEKNLKQFYPSITREIISYPCGKYFNPLLMYQYYRIIKKYSPDLIHSHDIWSLYALLPVMYFFPKIPIVATEHLYIEHKKRGLYRKKLFSRLDSMIAISKAMYSNVKEMYPLSDKQIETIYGGFAYKDAIQQNAPYISRQQLNISDDSFVIGMIGRIDPAKGQLELVKAFNTFIKTKTDKNIFLLIAGRPTLKTKESLSYEDKVLTYIKENIPDNKVKFTGFVNSVPEFLSVLDVFVMPSRFEAFGLVLIQAMSLGLPLIATDAGSAREIIDIKNNGFVYPPGNTNELAKHFDTLYSSIELRHNMKQLSLNRYENIFHYSHHLKNINSLYERKIAERKYPL